MWTRASTDGGVCTHTHASLLALVGALAVGVLLAACSSAPPKPTEEPAQPVTAAPPAAGKPGTAGALGAPGAAGATPPAPVEVTARGKADFDRAVGFMRAGNTTEAELEFKQVALQFPQLSSPYVNLGILYRKTGRLDQSEAALKTAVEHNAANAVAWTELGATQRLRGEFPTAAESYEKAIADDPTYAPPYRNLGVVTDLYLGDPERALTAFEKYKELTGQEKPVSTWIAELRIRLGKPPVKRPEPAATPPAGSSDAAPPAPAGQAAPAPDQKPADSQGAPPAAAPPPKAGE